MGHVHSQTVKLPEGIMYAKSCGCHVEIPDQKKTFVWGVL